MELAIYNLSTIQKRSGNLFHSGLIPGNLFHSGFIQHNGMVQ